jgi:hypothetical protein
MTERSLIDLAGLGVTEEVATQEVIAELVRSGHCCAPWKPQIVRTIP